MTALAEQINSYRDRVNRVLEQEIASLPNLSPRLKEAISYGVLLGGKRVRPFLVYATGDLLGIPLTRLDAPAAAIECIHAYSLIHDDLPTMDDDALRRGQPTCHIAFDEATAILAGDALQTMAFEILTKDQSQLTPNQQLKMVKSLASASGYLGMCGGQALDLAAEGKQINLAELETIHSAKTGALIRCAVQLGAIAKVDIDENEQTQLDDFAAAIGLAFQVQDDILDITSDTKTLGKPQGSDLQHNKSTYPALLGLEGAKDKALNLYQESLHALTGLAYNTQSLEEFARYIIQRDK